MNLRFPPGKAFLNWEKKTRYRARVRYTAAAH